MRESKFRGFNRKNGVWLYGFYLQNRGAHFVCPDEFADGKSWDDYEIDPETRGEYTCLKDKNGQEIYEGDIYWRDPAKGWSSWPYCVDYCNGAWIGKDSDGGWLALIEEESELLSNQLDYIEVVGNIHDNPELLNVER